MTSRFLGAMILLTCFVIGGVHPSIAGSDLRIAENWLKKLTTGVSDAYFQSDNILFLFGDEKRRQLYLTHSTSILVRVCQELVKVHIYYPITIYLVDERSANKPKGEWIEVNHIYCNAGAPEP